MQTLLHNHQPNPATKSAFLLTLLTPLAFPGFFPFDVNLVLAVVAALLFVACLILELKHLYIPKVFMLATASVFMVQLSLFASENVLAPEIWRLQCISYATAAVMLIAGISTSSYSLKVWMHLYMSVAAIWSVIGLFVWLGGTSGMPLEIGRITVSLAPALKIAGPFNQGNIFATAIGFALIFSHWLFIRNGKAVYALATLFFTAMLFDSLSKGGWLAFGLATALLVYALRPKPLFLAKRLVPLWLSGIALGLLFLEFSQPRASDAFLSIAQADASLGFRLLIWASAIAEYAGSPWSGIGWGQFPAEFWSANPQAQAWLTEHFDWKTSLYGNAMSAHNIFLHVLAEAGMIAALLFIWGILKLLSASAALIANRKSARLPFSLAALAFIIQSQLNISYTQPIPLLMAAFFSGITLAPWLRKKSWSLELRPAFRGVAFVVALMAVTWGAHISQQWFSAEQAIRDFDMQDKSSIRQLADKAVIPRVGAIPLIWLGYNVATTQEHSGLLTWMLPYLKQSIHEVPFVDAYQLLFYALAQSQHFEDACKLGSIISERNLPGEKNRLAYQEACEGKPISQYEFGH